MNKSYRIFLSFRFMSWQSISWSVLWHYSLKNLTLSLFKLCFNMFFRGENLCHRLIFLFSWGCFCFSPTWSQGMLSRQDCCWACILLWAPLWLWDRVCLCCGAWPQLWACATRRTPWENSHPGFCRAVENMQQLKITHGN